MYFLYTSLGAPAHAAKSTRLRPRYANPFYNPKQAKKNCRGTGHTPKVRFQKVCVFRTFAIQMERRCDNPWKRPFIVQIAGFAVPSEYQRAYHQSGERQSEFDLHLFSPGTQRTSPMPVLLAARAITNR
jgi:hypothetical protein